MYGFSFTRDTIFSDGAKSGATSTITTRAIAQLLAEDEFCSYINRCARLNFLTRRYGLQPDGRDPLSVLDADTRARVDRTYILKPEELDWLSKLFEQMARKAFREGITLFFPQAGSVFDPQWMETIIPPKIFEEDRWIAMVNGETETNTIVDVHTIGWRQIGGIGTALVSAWSRSWSDFAH